THREHRREAREHVVLLELVGAGLQAPRVLLHLGAQELEQTLLEARLMGAALGCRDDVHEALDDGVVPGSPAQRQIDLALAVQLGGHHVPVLLQHGNRLAVRAGALDAPHIGDSRIRREVFDELADAALEAEHRGRGLLAALVADLDAEPRHEERGLPRAPQQVLGLEPGTLGEDLAVGPIADARTGDALGDLADDAQLTSRYEGGERGIGTGLPRVREDTRLAAVERHRPGLAVAVDLDIQALRESVDDRGADTVQSSRRRVRTASELAAGVQLREDHLDARQSRLGLDVDRDAARAVAHLDRLVGVQDHIDLAAVATERLVDGVVDDLPQAVHEAARVGGPDVHAWPLANRLETLENGEMARGVVGHFMSLTGCAHTAREAHGAQRSQPPNC